MYSRFSYGINSCELYIDDLYKRYYHLYLFKSKNLSALPILHNPKWVEVDEETYNTFKKKYVIVMAKPLGYFEDQAKLNPPEISKAVVGNSNYGYYSGGVWHFYPNYRYLGEVLTDPYYKRPLPRDIESIKKDRIIDYYTGKTVLSDYAKKYGLDKEVQKRKAEERSLRARGSSYRGGGYGGFGK